MDMHTLLAANVMMFAMYAGVIYVSARILGGTKAAAWFSGASLAWALALSVVLLDGRLPAGVVQVGSVTLMVAGLAMLHRCFTELLERGKLLWRLQGVLFVLAVAGSLYLVHTSTAYPAEQMLVSSVLGIQTALIASALFSFSGEGVQAAGWFTGVAISLFAVIQMMRAAVTLRFGTPGYEGAEREMEVVWLCGTLLASSATAFGFLFIATGKLRLELLWRAQIDELTGLLNRWAFKRIAIKETFRSLRMRGRLAAIMMDLDGMKRVNDQLGHGGGDAVLQAISASLQEAVRDRDSIARMGGDEFCILLPDTEMEEALTVAERLRSQVEALEIRYRGETVRVQASFGVSSSVECGWNWQSLVDASDAALYEAKRGGHNKVVAARGPEPAVVAIPEVPMQPVSERRRR